MAKLKKKLRSTSPHHYLLYESFLYVAISFFVAFIFYELGIFHTTLHALNTYGYVGAFLGGVMFTSVFTAAPAAVILFTLSETLPIVPLALVAGIGAVVGDIILLRLLAKGIDGTIALFPKDSAITKVVKVLRHTKYRFFLTLIGALVIASPLPDELGLAMMGISQVNPLVATIITFILNTIGILLLLKLFR